MTEPNLDLAQSPGTNPTEPVPVHDRLNHLQRSRISNPAISRSGSHAVCLYAVLRNFAAKPLLALHSIAPLMTTPDCTSGRKESVLPIHVR
jgi:hypothetical protein